MTRYMRGFQRGLVIALVLAGAVFGGLEVRSRITHVHEIDARIAGELIIISSRVSGWVDDIAVEEGEGIAKNEVLVHIDGRESKLLVDELDAQMRSVASERARLNAERKLIDEQTKSRYETRLSKMSAAEASVSALDPQLELAISELERATSLFQKRVVPKQQLDQARATARQVEGEHRMAVAVLEESRSELQEARADRERLNVLDGELEMLRHRESALRAKVEQQKLDLADRTIRSPIDGVVDKTFVEAGEFVTSGQRLLLVHDPRRIWIEANIKETQIRKLKVGQPVEIHVDAYPDQKFQGEVVSIGNSTTGKFALLPNPNPSGNFTKITQRLPVRIGIQQEDRMLRPGMMVEVRIDVRKR
ncbi:MAG: HlyD family secretion protein [Gammaproteobacteria bacterium]|nr:HlyD family secretion protein [Gammaproteobacteria bacterium]